ncbi:alpha/beta fold hydrolase [Variovorax terrae]|uniref:Alpha/beta hydrolase n=1 Tax=Variovorax terrae TaxID=2923278 RepID=A0A9X1VZ90_9BURK|nr:alpha/beta hydrolase [Variovorax terrae]MCJ0764894.1 alpha/beta hydrolase [Variovorax terrae]
MKNNTSMKERESMIAYERFGNGPSCVFVLHGWFGDHGIWKSTYPLLDGERFSYVFVDYRGYGASRNLPGPHSMAQISADVRELAAHLGWARYAVVGHSMGGMAAQRVAIDAPQAVSAVVGVTPVPAGGVPLPPEVLAIFKAAATDDRAAAGVVEGSLGNRLTPALTGMILRHTHGTVAPEVFSAYLHAFTATDFSGECAAYQGPLLVLIGQHDQGVSDEFVRATFPRLYPQAVLQVLPNAGHYPMVETPAHLVAVIEAFLTQP